MLRILVKRIGFYLAASSVFMLLMLIGFSVFYHYTENLGWLDSFYFTVITTRTVGFGDISPKSDIGKIGTIFNALVPATVFLGASLVVLQTLMRELENYWRRYQMTHKQDHDIIVGASDLTLAMLKEYTATKRSFLVIDKTPYDQLPTGVQEVLDPGDYLCHDATKDEALLEAQLSKARSIVIATPDDSFNIYVLVTARSISERIKKIVRINNVENTSKFTSVGADTVLPAATIVGQMLSQASFHPHSHDFLVALHTHTREPFFEDATADASMIGQPVRDAYRRPVAIFRDGHFIYDLTEQTVHSGDVIIQIGLRM